MQAMQASSSFAGARLETRAVRRAAPARVAASPVAMAGKKKLFSYQDGWKKEAVGTGIFLEDYERTSNNLLSKIEKKKVLSSVEKAGLLTAASKAGLTLGKIEKLGLLSTAEKLGGLTLIEKLGSTDPALIASGAVPLVFGAVGAAALLPGAFGFNLLVAGAMTAGAATLMIIAWVLDSLNE